MNNRSGVWKTHSPTPFVENRMKKRKIVVKHFTDKQTW